MTQDKSPTILRVSTLNRYPSNNGLCFYHHERTVPYESTLDTQLRSLMIRRLRMATHDYSTPDEQFAAFSEVTV